MSDQQKNSSRNILIGSVVAAIVLMAAVVPFTIQGDKPRTMLSNADDVETRIQPVARFDAQKPAGAPVAASGKPRDGAAVFSAVCGACHNAGVSSSFTGA